LGLQESVVVAMADGFAQARNDAALVNLHSAIGVGHALGSIFTAYKNQTPLVITAGQQARSILPFEPFLYSEQAAQLPKPYVKWSSRTRARRGRARGDSARLLCRDAAAARSHAFVSVPVDDWDRVLCVPVQLRVTGQPDASPAIPCDARAMPPAALERAQATSGHRGRRVGCARRCMG
jgi:benzoylformate decarboxylase